MAQPYSLEGLLLCALRDRPDFGRNIALRISKLEPTFAPPTGALYPALQRLEDEGLARSEAVPQSAERGGRPRRVYRLTPAGKRQAQQLARFYVAFASPQEAA